MEGIAAANKKLDPVAAALRNASALLLASIKAVTAALGPVVSGETGARKVGWMAWSWGNSGDRGGRGGAGGCSPVVAWMDGGVAGSQS